jgi:hypothetical protein
MSRLMIALFVTAGLCLAGPALAQTHSAKDMPVRMSKDDYVMAKTNADAQYKIDRDACSSQSGNAKDICIAEAKGKDAMTKADAEAAYENTPKARQNARVVHAQATYNVANERCDDLAGNRKDVCVKEAKAELVRGTANAKVDRVTADAQHESAVKQSEAHKEANTDKRDADYKVAVEKCDALAGTAKESCNTNAKAQFGKM